MATDHDHPQNIVIHADGSEEYQDPWTVESDETLTSDHTGSVCVHEGATFEIGQRGNLTGSLSIRPGATARVHGNHTGSVHVSGGGVLEVIGNQTGSSHVNRGGVVRVRPGGTLTGSLHVAGLIENQGSRGGSVTLDGGEVRDLEGSSVKQPTRLPGGGNSYTW